MKPESTAIWRSIVRVRHFMNPGHWKSRHVGGRTRITLSCGHDAVRKISEGIPAERVRCRTCENLRDGALSAYGNPDGTGTLERWDEITKLPARLAFPTYDDAKRALEDLRGAG